MGGLEIASLFAKVSASTESYDKSMRNVRADLTTTESAMTKLGGLGVAAFKAVAVAAAAIGVGIVAGVGAAVSAASSMEQGMADIGAMMTLTSAETVKLQDHIMDLGLDPTLKVSATEAAGAVMALGTAGLSMTQIMGGASEATVLLANATGLKDSAGFAAAANIATDVMAQFNITAGDLDKAVNQIAGTTVASKFTIDDYRLAIAMAGGVAGAVGLGFEDFNAIIAATSSSFASGSDAGTSLKTMLQRLHPSTEKAKELMGELGLYTHGTTSEFFDASGSMKSAEEIAGLLNTAFRGLSDAQKIEAATTIFGTDAMRSALALADGGTPIITKMKGEIGKVDAEELAKKRMDTLAGSWEIFRGVAETLTLGIGNKFLPVARKLVDWTTDLAQRYGPPVIEWIGKVAGVLETAIVSIHEAATTGQILNDKFAALPKPIQDAIKAAAAFIETLKTVVGKVVTSVSGFVDWQKVLDAVTTTLPPLWEKLVTVGRTIGDVIAMVKATFAPLGEAIGKFFGWKDIATALGAILVGSVIGAIGSFIVALWPVIALVAQVTAVVTALRWAWENDFWQIRTVTENVLHSISNWFYNESGIWKGTLEKTLAYLKWWGEWGWRDALWNPVTHWILETTNYIKGKWHDSINDLGDIWNTLKWEAQKGWNDFSVAVTHIVLTLWDGIVKKVSDSLIVLKSDVNLQLGWLQRYWTDLKDGVVDTYEKMVENTQQWVKDTFAWFKPREWLDAGIDMVQGLWDGMKQIWSNVKSWWTGEAPELGDEFAGAYKMHSPSQVFHDFGANMMQGLQMGIGVGIPAVATSLQSIGPKVNEVMGTVIGSMTENGVTLMGHVSGLIDQSALWVKTSLENGAQMWKNTIDGTLRPVLKEFTDMTAQATAEEKRLRDAWGVTKAAQLAVDAAKYRQIQQENQDRQPGIVTPIVGGAPVLTGPARQALLAADQAALVARRAAETAAYALANPPKPNAELSSIFKGVGTLLNETFNSTRMAEISSNITDFNKRAGLDVIEDKVKTLLGDILGQMPSGTYWANFIQDKFTDKIILGSDSTEVAELMAQTLAYRRTADNLSTSDYSTPVPGAVTGALQGATGKSGDTTNNYYYNLSMQGSGDSTATDLSALVSYLNALYAT